MTALHDAGEQQAAEAEPIIRTRQYWPEAVRHEPRPDSFPWRVLITGFLPGAIGIILLLVPFVWLRQQAGRDIVFVTANGQLNAVQANQDNQRAIGKLPLQLDGDTQRELASVLPVLGLPQWSPDGQQLVTTIGTNTNIQVAFLSPITGTVTILSPARADSNILVAPGDGWSPDGTYLALLETDRQQPFLTLVDLSQEELEIKPINLILNTSAGLDWHPEGDQLLVTTIPDGISPSTLQIVNVTGQVQPFTPNDGQLLRVDAIWSPNGQRIAYVSIDPAQAQAADLPAGTLWVANSTGEGARELVSEGLNMAPIWDEADPGFIYFTRYVTTTNSYDLYRVNTTGSSPEQRLGSSNEILINYPFDRHHFLVRTNSPQPLAIAAEPLPSISREGWTPDRIVRAAIQNAVPVLGIPRWSPDGRFLAATEWQSGKILPAIYNANLQPVPSLGSVFDVMAVPSDGWSTDGSALALVEHDGARSLLTLSYAPFDAQHATAFDFTLDDRVGIDWHPLEQRLLVTAYTEESATPGLFVVDASGQSQPFVPGDGHLLHADAVWSPDGTLVAYVASDTFTTTQAILPGELYIADSDGNNARLLVADVQAIAPIWSPAGDTIYYTQFTNELGGFALYRVAVDGSRPPEYVGPSSEVLVLYPFDRNLFLQWSPDGSQLLFVGAEPLPPAWYLAHAPTAETVTEIRTNLPIFGAPQWSPDGAQFAGTVLDRGEVRVVMFKSPSSVPVLSPATTDLIVMPTDGWSPDGAHLALLRHDGSVSRLAIMDTVQSSLSPSTLELDLRAGLSWHPNSGHIMVTAKEEGITPTLRIHTVQDNSTAPFVPDDAQAVHADGVWSPDGQQVAYIAHDNITNTLETEFLAGPLWLSDSSGQNARQLVANGLNFAPMWDLAQERILFTRFITETRTFDLYQVDLDGETVEHLGPGSEVFAQFPFDRQLFWRWSPEGIRWLLPGEQQILPFIHYVMDRNTAVAPLPTPCDLTIPFAARWAPTGRSVLVACPSGEMFLHWMDRERTSTKYPDGFYPSWQR